MLHIMSDTQKVSQAFVEEEDDMGRLSEPQPVEKGVQTEAGSGLTVERREETEVKPPGIQFHEDYEEEEEFKLRESGPVLMIEAVDGTEIFGKKAIRPLKPILTFTTSNLPSIFPQFPVKKPISLVPIPTISIHSPPKDLQIVPCPSLQILPYESDLLEPFFSLVRE